MNTTFKTISLLTAVLLAFGCCFMSSCKDKKRNAKDSTEGSSEKKSTDMEIISDKTIIFEVKIPLDDILRELAGIKEKGQDANFDKALNATDLESDNFVAEFCRNYNATGYNLRRLFKDIKSIQENPQFSDNDIVECIEENVDKIIENTNNTLKKRLELSGIKEYYINKTDRKGVLKITMPLVDDLDRIIYLLNRKGNLEFYETYQYKVLENTIKDLSDSYAKSTASNDSTGNAQKSLLNLIGCADGNSCVIGNALVTDTAAVNKIIHSALANEKLPNDLKLCWSVKPEKVQDNQSEKFQLVALKTRNGEPVLTGDVVTSATTTSYENMKGSAINITMNDEGAKRWSRITDDNIGKSVAIVFEDQVYSFPLVNDQIAGGRTEITGNFTPKEAADFATVLQSGYLRVKPQIISQKVVKN